MDSCEGWEMNLRKMKQADRERFIYNNDFVFESALRQLLYSYYHKRGDKGFINVISNETMYTAKQYLRRQSKTNRKYLALTLSHREKITNFEVLEVLKFVEFYKQKRDRLAKMK